MPLYEVRASVDAGCVESLADTLAAIEATRWLIREDRGLRRAWLSGFFGARAEAWTAWRRLAAAVGVAWMNGKPAVRQLAERDWRERYKHHFRPWHIGRLHWAPIWRRRTYRVPGDDRVVWLDPGMAFGTGDHATTRLCCERLVAFSKVAASTRSPARGDWGVIDAGCGSGILAISAARLGADRVFGFDLDPEAVRISRANSRLNAISGRVRFTAAGLPAGLAGRRAHLVLANIQTDVLVRYRHLLADAVLPGGWLSLSGILQRELGEVRAAFAKVGSGWRTRSRRIGEWADLLLIRP